jgi:hypothetical protein
MEHINDKLLFVEHPFRKGVRVNLYPLFEKLENFTEECGGTNDNSFSAIDKFLTKHIKMVSVDLLPAAKDEVSFHDMNSMFFSLYKLKEVFEDIQEIKT